MAQSLEEFEKMLKSKSKTAVADKPKTSLELFEEQLKNKNTTPANTGVVDQSKHMTQPGVDPNDPNTKTIKIKKNLIVSFPSDFSGCGHIRNIFPLNYLNSVFARGQSLQAMISPYFLYQQDFLARARTLFFQRMMTREHLHHIKKYKEQQKNFKYKMVWDIDDFIWGHNEEQPNGTKDDGVPSYNFGARGITDDIKSTVVEIMNLMDTCTFSTQFLADYAKNVLKVTADCVVVPNSVSQFFWGIAKKPDIVKKFVKPRVIYTGSPTHYMNPLKDDKGNVVNKAKLGDFDNAWAEWVIKAVKEDKITFICMGGLPWFFEEIKDKITVHQFIDSFRYHNLVKAQVADIGIMPVVPNNFNHSKSDIKAIEHYADCVPCIGTVFTNGKPSPYDNNPVTLPDNCTVEDIEKKMDWLCEPENYNKIKNEQWDKMFNEGRWTESPAFINILTKYL